MTPRNRHQLGARLRPPGWRPGAGHKPPDKVRRGKDRMIRGSPLFSKEVRYGYPSNDGTGAFPRHA